MWFTIYMYEPAIPEAAIRGKQEAMGQPHPSSPAHILTQEKSPAIKTLLD